MKKLQTTRKLPVKLNTEELLDRGKSLVENMRKTALAEEERELENKKRKGDIALLEEVTARLAGAISRGEEDREVDCETVKDFERGTVTVFRNDTGEQVEQRTLTIEERQEELKMPPPPRKPAKGSGADPFAEETPDP